MAHLPYVLLNMDKRGMEKKDNKIKKIKLTLIFLSTLSLFFFLIVTLTKRAFVYVTDKTFKVLRPDRIVLSLDNIYSWTLKNDVSLFVSSYFSDNKIDKLNLIEFDLLIKNKFKFIKNIEWDFSLPSIAKLNLVGKEPFCFLNKNSVLSENNDVFDLSFFQDYKISYSRECFIKENDLSDQVFSFLKKVPDLFWYKYCLNYKNKNYIKLIPRATKTPIYNSFLFNKKTITNKGKLLLANKIFKDLYKNNKLFSNKKYTLDLRFDNRILLRKENIIHNGRV